MDEEIQLSRFAALCIIIMMFYFISKFKIVRIISRKISFIVTFILQSFLYFYLIESYKFKHVGFSAIILFAIQCVLIVRLETTDPGILTKKNAQLALKVWPYDDQMYKMKACRHTGLLVPARCRYCREIKCRVLKFSHFSYLFSQPIGINNMRHYLATIAASALSSIFFSIRCFVLLSRKVAPADLMDRTGFARFCWSIYLMCSGRPAKTLILVVFCCLSLFTTLSFVSDCIYVSRNTTPHENCKRDFIWKRGYNPYDKGFKENWNEVLHPKPFVE